MSEAMLAAARLYNDPRYFSPSEIRIRNNRIKRQRIVRRQIIVLSIIATLFLFITIFMASSFMADAQSDSYTPEFKYYKTITVHSGDTLWEIANDNYNSNHYDDIYKYIVEIKDINVIDDLDSLSAGEALILPYYSTEFK